MGVCVCLFVYVCVSADICVCLCVHVCVFVLQMSASQVKQGRGQVAIAGDCLHSQIRGPDPTAPPAHLPTPPSILTRELRQSSSLQKCFLSRSRIHKCGENSKYSKSVLYFSRSGCFNPWIKRVEGCHLLDYICQLVWSFLSL